MLLIETIRGTDQVPFFTSHINVFFISCLSVSYLLIYFFLRKNWSKLPASNSVLPAKD